MNIRLATAADVTGLSELEQLCQPSPWSELQLLQALTLPNQIWMGCIQQQVVSMLVWQVVMDEAEIHLLNTHPAYQRQGYARLLLQYVMHLAQQQQLRRLLLEVRASNEGAQRLYYQCGFQVCARRRGYYAGMEDALILEKLC